MTAASKDGKSRLAASETLARLYARQGHPQRAREVLEAIGKPQAAQSDPALATALEVGRRRRRVEVLEALLRRVRRRSRLEAR
jgi:hypothetical protein